MSSLFRPEALENQKENFFGEVLLIQPLSTTVLTIVTVVLTIGIALFLCLGSYTPKETVEGYLVPDKGLAKLYAPALSSISQVLVKEGEHVVAGQLLLSGATERSQSEGDDVDAVLLREIHSTETSLAARKETEISLFAKEKSKLIAQRDSAKKEVAQLEIQIATQAQRLALAEKRQEAAKKLLAESYLSEAAYQEQYEVYLAQRQQQEELQRQKEVRESNYQQAIRDLESLPLQQSARLFEIDKGFSELHQRQAEVTGRRHYALRAPFDGIITATQVHVGQNVGAGSFLMAVLPEGAAFYAQLFVPTRAVGFIEVGQPVRIRYTAFPHQKFGIYTGTVSEVARTILLPSELPIPVALKEPVYSVSVRLDAQDIHANRGNPLALQSGMLLEADIVLQERTLLEWILSPLYQFKGHL